MTYPSQHNPIRKLPDLSKDLLDRLDEMYPARCADISWPDRKVWYYAGQRAVIDHLIAVYNEQNETTIIQE